MNQWEYKLLSTNDLEKRGFFKSIDPSDAEKYFNSLGDEGWEIINIDFIDTTAFIGFHGLARRPKN